MIRRRIRLQTLWAVGAVGLVPLIVATVLFVTMARRNFDVQVSAGLEALVLSRKAKVEGFVEEKHRQLKFIVGTLSFDELSRAGVLEKLSRDMQQYGGIVDLGLVDSDGRQVNYVGPYDLRGQSYRESSWFREVIRRGSFKSDVFLGRRGYPHVILAVRGSQGNKEFVLRATLDTDVLSSLLTGSQGLPGAEVFILNRAGEYQTRVPDHRLMARSSLGPVAPHGGLRVVTAEHDIAPKYVASAWLRDETWVLVVTHPVPGLLDILKAEPGIFWVILLLAGAVPLLAVLLARLRDRQLRQLEAHHAAQLQTFTQHERMATVSRMASSVARELSAPLTSIQKQIVVLASRTEQAGLRSSTSELHDPLSVIGEQVRRAERVCEGLLQFSHCVRQEGSKFVDVEACLDKTLGFVEQGEASKVRLVRHYAPDVPSIQSKSAQTQQVLLTLLNSALDAVGDQGEVHVHVVGSGHGVEIRIHDDGPGIPPEQLTRVFEPFSKGQTESAGTRDLELALCREMMQSLGGRIGVTSAPGEGTTCSLWFPSEPQQRNG